MISRLLAVVVLVGAVSCDNSFFLAGTLNGDCDPPKTILAVPGGPDVPTIRTSNCQVAGAVCCRRSSAVSRTSCQYPEDCYVAPYMGSCATAVDCADTQQCTGGSCQCTLGGPPCEDPTTRVTTCCTSGQVCLMGVCTDASM